METKLLPAFATKALRFACIVQIAATFLFLTPPVTLAQEEEKKTNSSKSVPQTTEAATASEKPMRSDLAPKSEPAANTLDNTSKWWQSPTMTGGWNGVRTRLEEKGVTFSGNVTFDSSRGGHNDEMTSASRGLFDLKLTFDLGKIAGLEGGTVAVQYYTLKGPNGAGLEDHLQTFSNIDSDRFSKMAEVWYEQWLFKRRARVKVGRVDANKEFAFVENGGEFINASMGYSPTIFTLPTYPNPMNSINLFVYPTKRTYVGAGLYDSKGTGAFVIAEGGTTWSLRNTELPGRVGIGGWRQTGGVERFSGDRVTHTSGFYMVADQTIWRGESKKESTPRSVKAYFQFGHADFNVSAVNKHVGTGVAWTGAIPHREQDVFGVGPTWIRVSEHPNAGFTARGELALEAFYKIQLTPWLSVKPDFQYMRTPGGANSFKRTALGTVRFTFSF